MKPPVWTPCMTHTKTKGMTSMEYIARASDGAANRSQFDYIAFVKGEDCEDDICEYGATPEEAIKNLRELLGD